MRRAFLAVALAIGVSGPAAAQYYPPPRPPPGPPPGYYPPPPPRAAYYPPRPPSPPLLENTLRVSGGVSLVTSDYYCSYAYAPGFAYPTCGAAYSVALADVNLDLDLALSRTTAVTVGANVMWGDPYGTGTTIWEPHLDLLLRGSPFAAARGRLRLGAGLYVASVSVGSTVATDNVTGGCLRIGAGLSLMADAPVGIGLDAIFEAGSLNGYYFSTLQFMVGPEFHF